MINGPNLNLLGDREPDVYGTTSLAEINEDLRQIAEEHGVEILCYQSNHEGDILDFLHLHRGIASGILINPGAFTHYSYALRDGIAAMDSPAVEIHISDINSREDFRSKSVIRPVCIEQISGQGVSGYGEGLLRLIEEIKSGN